MDFAVDVTIVSATQGVLVPPSHNMILYSLAAGGFTLDNFSMDFFSLKGKVVIVTGGNTGLGQGYAVAFANELARYNIQTNAIEPGYIKTANTASIREDENRNKEIESRIPAERWGVPYNLMGTAVFLASRASHYINGHILVVDGGWLVR